MKRVMVRILAAMDEALDEVLYRPAVVKAFAWLPRWWLCDLAKLSMRLDERWGVEWWGGYGPAGVCDVCRRRAAWLVVGGSQDDEEGDCGGGDDEYHVPEISTCSWCHLEGPIESDQDLARELEAARRDSISWSWRWRPYRAS